MGWLISNFTRENFPNLKYLGKVLYCQKCSTLWFGIIYMLIFSPSTWFLAPIASYIGFILNNYIKTKL
jgi:hypothetical protein